MSEKLENRELLTDMKEVSRLARSFLKNWDSGVLSTLYYIEDKQYPMGSMTPYVLTDEGDISILVSDIAHHTKNMWKCSQVSFTVFDMNSKHKQAASRVSIVGDAYQIDETKESDKFKAVSERYFTFFPVARNYFKAHNFYFFTIKPKHIHFIKTFGQIYDYKAKDNWSIMSPKWRGSEQSVIDHMNKDHADALVGYAKNMLKQDKKNADLISLASIDTEGFHLKVGENYHYLNFNGVANELNDLRREFVQLAKECP